MDWGEMEDVFEVVGRRREFLALLATEELDKASMVRRLDVSRSTVNRAVSALESYGLVERRDGCYATTATGDLVREHYAEALSTVRRLMEARPLLEGAKRFDAPPALFRDASVVTSAADRHAPVRVLVDLLLRAEAIRSDGSVFRIDVPTSVRERLLEDDEVRMEVVFSMETLEWARTYHEPDLQKLVAASGHEVRVAEAHHSTTIAVLETPSTTFAVVVFYDDRGEPTGLVYTTDPMGVVWATDHIDESWRHATPATAVLDG